MHLNAYIHSFIQTRQALFSHPWKKNASQGQRRHTCTHAYMYTHIHTNTQAKPTTHPSLTEECIEETGISQADVGMLYAYACVLHACVRVRVCV